MLLDDKLKDIAKAISYSSVIFFSMTVLMMLDFNGRSWKVMN